MLDCKTQNCKTVHVLMHLGEKGKTPAKVEYWMSYPLTVRPAARATITQTQRNNSGKNSFRLPYLPRMDTRIGSPRHRFRTHFLHKKLTGSRLLLRHHHMHGGYSGDVFIPLITKGGQIHTCK